MNKIAEEIGIRKQSLSYHYPSKSKLLKDTYQLVVQEEINFIEDFLTRKFTSTKDLLWSFLEETERRYYKLPNVAFLQIMAYRAPKELDDFIGPHFREYKQKFMQNLMTLKANINLSCSPEEFAISFITIYDGLIVQLVYEDSKRFNVALQASFTVFWKGVTSNHTSN